MTMHVFWRNGELVLHPDSAEEGEALDMLLKNGQKGRPKEPENENVPVPVVVPEASSLMG
jgi:hypothetical protein